MLIAAYFFMVLGALAYGIAVFYIGHSDGETYSDIGNAAWLLTAVLLLLRLNHGGPRAAASADTREP